MHGTETRQIFDWQIIGRSMGGGGAQQKIMVMTLAKFSVYAKRGMTCIWRSSAGKKLQHSELDQFEAMSAVKRKNDSNGQPL